MAKSIESTLTSIDEQINALKKKKKEEIAKMEQKVGKMFITAFDLSNQPLSEIQELIEQLSSEHNKKNSLKNE